MKKASKLLILAVCLLALVLAMTLVACDGGGQNTTHSDHTASGEWQSDESGHWHVCDEGGEKTDVAAHNLIAQEQDGKHYFKCEVCDYRTEPEAHTPSETYKSDGINHWQECTVCHLPVNKQAHTPESEVENLGEIGHRFKCEVCQRTIEDSHAFDEENPESDEQNHWLKCLYCDATTQPEAHTLGEYIIDGERHSQQCEECGATVNEAAHKANYALGYFADESGHWYECDCGQKMEFAAHEKNEASYTSNDSEHWYSCKICLYQMEAEAHTLGEYISDGVKHYKQCEVCLRKALMADCVPSEQHISENGEEYHNCATCGNKVEASTEEFYDMDEAEHWLACPICKKELGEREAHYGFEKYEYSIEGHWYVCEGCENRILSEHKYEDDVCTECNYFEGLEYWTFEQQSSGKWYVAGYTGTQTVVKLPTRDADGHTITGLKSGVFSTENETSPHNDYVEEVYIPEGYTHVAPSAFRYCASLKKVHFPSTLSTFYSLLFANAPLDELYIEDLAAFVQANCTFKYTSDLPFLTHGDKTFTASHTIDLYVQGELVKDLVIPEGVEQLGFGIFANNCFGLNSITLPTTLTQFSSRSITAESANYGTDAFTESDISRWVPRIVVPDYEKFFLECKMDQTGQSRIAYRQLNEIDVVFMKDGEAVTDIVLPDGLQSLDLYNMLASDNITTITVNEQLYSWRGTTFYGCKNLHAIRNLENSQVASILNGIFDGLALDEPLKMPATCKSFDDPGDTDAPIYFAKGVRISLGDINTYRGKEIAIESYSISANGFDPSVKLDRVYFYSETEYNTFVTNYRKYLVSDLRNANAVKTLYEAEAILYSETCPEDTDLQGARWHWNDKGEIELWSKTVNGDQVTIERDEEFWRDAYYHDITNDGDEYTYRLKAAAESGKEIVWTSLTEGATVTQDGDVTATKIGSYRIKAAVKDNEAIYAIATVTFYPSTFYFTGTLNGEATLENVNKNAGNLGDREDLKFVDDGTHKSFTLCVNLAKNDEFSIGYLGSDVKLGKTAFDRKGSYQTFLNLNNVDDCFKMRNKGVVTITVTIQDDNTVLISMAFMSPPSGYDLTVRKREGNDATNTIFATAYLNMSQNFGSVFKVSVVYTSTINNFLDIAFGSKAEGADTTTKYYVSQNSFLHLSGDAYSNDRNATNRWVSYADNDLHIWYQSSEDGTGNTDSWEFTFTVRADGELLAVEINFAKEAEE